VHSGVRHQPELDHVNDYWEAFVSGKTDVRIVPKPWGHETIWAHTDLYVGKVLHIKAGHSLSVQYHEKKDETIHLLSGTMIYRVGTRDGRSKMEEGKLPELRVVELKAGESFRNEPGLIHQMEAVTDCVLLEASTPHLDDVVRLTDRYGRQGTSAP
jgi:mannose-6-phosphate isomerase-like protein (cupin superfamily)